MNVRLSMAFVAAASILTLTVSAHAQDPPLLPTDWPTQCGDSCNSSRTDAVPPADLKILWEKPAVLSQSGHTNPRVYTNSLTQQLVVTERFIYDAWTGNQLADLETYAAWFRAITTVGELDVLLITQLVSGLQGTESEVWELVAYDISDLTNGTDAELLWTVSVNDDLSINGTPEINARNGIFYVHANAGVSALAADTGNVIWESLASEWPSNGGISDGPPAIARVDGEDRDFVAITGGGVVALSSDGNGGAEVDWRQSFSAFYSQPCVNEQTGLVYASARDPYRLFAFDAGTGELAWDAPLGFFLNCPPSLGWAQDSSTGPVPAVFAVTGGGDNVTGVYAFNGLTGDQLWQTTLPVNSWKVAVYCGNDEAGKLYVQANNSSTSDIANTSFGQTYVLNAFTGVVLPDEMLATNALNWPDSPGAAVANIILPESSSEEVVMYVSTESDTVTAWSRLGTTPVPPIYALQVEARPDQISINFETQVVATLTVNKGEISEDMTITFSCDAGNNQGYLESTSAIVDSNGEATVTYVSQNRTGTVTVTAIGPGSPAAQTTITIAKVTEDPPPPTDLGSIQGVVYTSNGKPARKVSVTLSGAHSASTTTNPKGKYTFENLPLGAGTYTVSVDTGDEAGSTSGVSLTTGEPNATGIDVHLVQP